MEIYRVIVKNKALVPTENIQVFKIVIIKKQPTYSNQTPPH